MNGSEVMHRDAIDWPREWDEFRMKYHAHTQVKAVEHEEFDDDGLGCARGVCFVLLVEAIGLTLGIAAWWMIWAVLPA